MTSEIVDVVVIGAGINGVGVAQEAAANGHSVIVLEQNSDVGMETSSRSSKLIHGGLRYLESFEFSLVRESLKERELLLKIAPELVRLIKFNIPIYKTTRRNRLTLHAGLSLYALLAGLHKHTFYRQIPPSQWRELDGLTLHDLKTVFQYHDAQTDDRQLTRAVMASAIRLGAELQLNSRFIGAKTHPKMVEVEYQKGEETRVIKSRVMVNASGPWVNTVMERISPRFSFDKPELVQGSHLILNTQAKQAYYMEAPQDGRAVFLLPWQGHALLGTTELVYEDDPARVKITETEKNYLLEVYHHYFPNNEDTILGDMAGCRVLPYGGHNLFKRSRETVFEMDNRGLPKVISIVGGKLTGYRQAAKKTMRFIKPSLAEKHPIADTAKLILEPVDNLPL